MRKTVHDDPKLKIALVIFLPFFSGLALLPALKPVKEALPEWWNEYLAPAGINLGLDLQGGLHIVLRVDMDKAPENALDMYANDFKNVLADQGIAAGRSLGQVHGDNILALRDMPEREEYPGFDAAITDVPVLALLIRQADCQAVLLHDPARRVVAAVHCGWRGSVAGIIGKTIARMREEFAVNPKNLRALISPSLGPCCAEFLRYRDELPEWMWAFRAEKPAHFDFWAISRRQLADAGVLPEHIETTGICTRCNRDYFSYRRAGAESGGICGRQGSAVGLTG